jgi:hypothetical protein
MTAYAIKGLSIAQNDIRQKKQPRPRSIRETAGTAYSIICKNNNGKREPPRWQIIQELKELGYSDLEANQGLRNLEDNHEIFLIEDSGLLKILLYRNILSSEFERQQKQLQDSWLRAREEGGCFF